MKDTFFKVPKRKGYYLAKMITPEQLCKSGSEDGHQTALFMWAAINVGKYPDLKWLFAIPNGGWRDKITANKLKATGVKSGVPDIFLPVACGDFNGLFIELKRPTSVGKKAGVVSAEQKEWKEHLLCQGYGVYIAYGWEDARDCIVNYLEHE